MGQPLSRLRATGRLLLAGLLLAAAVGCGGSGATFQAFVPGGATGSGEPGGGGSAATPSPSPIESSWADVEQGAEGALVALTGRIRAGVMVSCFSGVCDLVLADPADDSRTVLVDVLAVDAAGVPNTMVELPDPFTEDDLRLTAGDGQEVLTGDLVRVVGTLEHGDGYVMVNLQGLDVVAEPAPTTAAAPETVTFKQLAKRPEGALARIRGTLSVPWFTFCNDRICSIELDDPKSARTAGLFMPAIRGGDARRNGMLPLPGDSEKERDIDVTRVVAVP